MVDADELIDKLQNFEWIPSHQLNESILFTFDPAEIPDKDIPRIVSTAMKEDVVTVHPENVGSFLGQFGMKAFEHLVAYLSIADPGELPEGVDSEIEKRFKLEYNQFRCSVYALGNIGTPECKEVLNLHLKNCMKGQYRYVGAALCKIGGEGVAETMLRIVGQCDGYSVDSIFFAWSCNHDKFDENATTLALRDFRFCRSHSLKVHLAILLSKIGRKRSDVIHALANDPQLWCRACKGSGENTVQVGQHLSYAKPGAGYTHYMAPEYKTVRCSGCRFPLSRIQRTVAKIRLKYRSWRGKELFPFGSIKTPSG